MDRNIKVCRICLNTDVKMFYIDDVLEYYISLLANDESYTMFPNYICYECASLLMKFIKFRKKYIAAQSILSNIVKECGEIKEDEMKGIHHSIIELKSNLGCHQLFSISLNNKINDSDFVTNPEVYIKPEIEEAESDNEVTALTEEEIEIDTKPVVEVEDNQLDCEGDLADNTINNFVNVEASSGANQFGDNLPLGILVNKIKKDKIKGIQNSIIELKSNLGCQQWSTISLSNKINEVVLSHEEITSDYVTNPEVYIKPEIEEAESDNEITALAEEEIEIDTKPEVEDDRLDCEGGLADNAIINFVNEETFTEGHQFGDDLPFGIMVDNTTDEENQIDEKLKRKRELTNARVKKHRKKKRIEFQQLNSGTYSMQDDPSEKMKNNQVKENTAERKRAMANERARRFREKKRLNALKSIHHVVHDSQNPEPSHGNPPLLLKNQLTVIHDSQIAGTSKNMSISLVTRDNSENFNRIGDNLLVPRNEENQPVSVDDNLEPLKDQVCPSPNLNVQFNRSSATYSTYVRHSSAHVQFHKQFIQNEFGYACKICDRLWFKGDLKNLNDDGVEFVRTFLPNVDEHPIAVCFSCRTSIQKKIIPKMSVYNGFVYPSIPENLRNCPLDIVSERLISPKIPFKQIRRLRHVHGQYGIYGQVINVPVEVNTMVNKLPRNINYDHCIYVHIKRKKVYKLSLLHRIINKHTIKEWLQYLVNTPLYRTYNITIDKQFFDNKHDEDGSDENDEENNDSDLEDIPVEESLLAQQQTVMWNDDLYLNIAPGENNVFISLLFDEHTEELSFPSIYLGKFRQFREGVIVTPFMIASSELRRSDRRGVTPHHLLYMTMKIMRIRVKDSIKIAFKHIGKKRNITKDEIQSEDYIHNCIESNLAFLRSIPNSTWYWSERKKDLFAMIRQLGKPTVFFTISANEIGWLDLLQLLYKLKTHVHITREEISKLHYIVKSTLINEDAVTCAIYFNKLVNVVMNILQSKICSPFKKYRVRHYFKRIEFQHRGSPHAHILAWLDNAPKDPLNEDYAKTIELIDTLISVSEAEASSNIELQTHKHTFTCYKTITAEKAQKCQFEAPFMPCRKTIILTPMKNTEEGFINYQKRYAQIRVRLENEDFENMDNFYNRNGIISDEDYYNIIRAGINRPKVFVKREPSEKWHNSFNPFIINIAQSNTDFQFIIEEYSCAAYVVEYINKANRGVSHLQRKIIEITNEHPEFDILDITENISLNILNNTEITSQEAAWYLLREPMSKTSVTIVYIPTVWPIERQRIRKTMKELSELDDDCTDIWKENWFDKYEKRPEYLESITLAQFVSKYTQNREKEYIERHEPKIIRYRNYDKAIDVNEYKREMVTLHLPFRNEQEEILADMKFVTIYDENEDIILQRRKEFELDIDKTIQICRELCREETPVDEDKIQEVVNRFPRQNLFEQ